MTGCITNLLIETSPELGVEEAKFRRRAVVSQALSGLSGRGTRSPPNWAASIFFYFFFFFDSGFGAKRKGMEQQSQQPHPQQSKKPKGDNFYFFLLQISDYPYLNDQGKRMIPVRDVELHLVSIIGILFFQVFYVGCFASFFHFGLLFVMLTR